MAGADELCDLLFLWLKKRKQCAEKLLALAKELEDVHKKSTVTQVVGSATSVVALSAAGVITLLTGGLATPLLVATTVGTIAGAAVEIASTAIEAIVSGSTMKDAKNLIQEDEKIGKNIQEAIENLKKKCGEQHGPSDVDYEVASQIMRALARRNNVDVPPAFLRLFVRSMFNEDINGLNAATVVHQMVILSALTLLFQLGIEGLEVGAKGLGRSAAYIGAKGAAKGATKAGFKLLGVVGFGVSLYSLVSNCEEMLKSNQGTEASQALRDAARKIQEARSNLKEQLNAMNEIITKMSELKNLIGSVRKYSLSMTETGQKIIDYVIQSWSDNEVISWLKTLPHQIQFINLLHFFASRLDQLPDRLKRNRGGHIDIVIVAHGEITNVFMPARLLMPTPTIIDTVLYSPWNCLIDAYAACAIAEGWHNTEGRYFYNPNHTDLFEPNPLPNYWNHMQRSFHPVPVILLTPVYPEEPVWKMFLGLQGEMDRDGRVIIPYLVPEDYVEVFGKIPFFMFIIALSYILMINEKTATMHLAACLGRQNSKEMPSEWLAQYAYTYDQTSMTDRNKAFMNCSLFRAFRAMFKTNSSLSTAPSK